MKSKNYRIDRIKETFSSNYQQFGRDNFYQSLPELKISGQRSTEKRLKIYELRKFINKKTSVLDIGSNCGFLSLTVSRLAKSVNGLEPNSSLTIISNDTKQLLKIKNCKFINKNFKDFHTNKRFDVILSFAVHFWVNLLFYNFIKKINKMLKLDGYLILESHELKHLDKDFSLRIKVLENFGFRIIKKGLIEESKDFKRKFVIVQKKTNETKTQLKILSLLISLKIEIKIFVVGFYIKFSNYFFRYFKWIKSSLKKINI
tara:strand:- start:2162 stop:2938 length:777 start_codon:yes stop_codon:yes gene_type:complete